MSEEADRIDPAITRALQAAAARGVDVPRVGVIVELAARTVVPDGTGDPAARLVELEQQTRAAQQGLIDHLDRIGVRGTPIRLTLANAVVVDLTADQVASVAARPDVRRLVRADSQHVIT